MVQKYTIRKISFEKGFSGGFYALKLFFERGEWGEFLWFEKCSGFGQSDIPLSGGGGQKMAKKASADINDPLAYLDEFFEL